MELLQIQYFRTVARTGNMTRAAQELHIAQSSLSKTISRLEAQVGAQLFDRKGKRLMLNTCGAAFLTHVEGALEKLDDGLRQVRDLADQQEASVSVGAATTRMLPDLIKDFLTRYPDARLQLYQVTDHNALLHKLAQGEADLAISSLPLEPEGVCCRRLLEEPVYLMVPAGHPLSTRKAIRFREIGGEPLILYTAECGLRDTLEQAFRQVSFSPNTSCECTTPEVICGLVKAGAGLAFLPAYLLGAEYAAGLTGLRVTEPDLRRSIWLSWSESRYLSLAARTFQKFVLDYYASEQN